MTEEEINERRRRRRALLLIPLLLLGAALCFWTLFASVSLGEAESFIPAPLGSDALANYGKDDIRGRLRSLSISIVEAVIRDRDPEEENVDSRVEDVSDSLKSPVPTVTPKPGDPTGTPTGPPTTTSTPDLSVTGTVTATGSPSPSPIASTATPTKTPTNAASSTPGPSATPTSTPLCYATPYIQIISPLPDQRFTLDEELPGQAFAFDPDNVDPVACSTAVAIFPDDDGDGLTGNPEVEMRVEWWNGGSWVLVHAELENSEAYCPFGDVDPFCLTHDLSTGEWPDSTPINIGLHRMKAKVLQDDEGVSGVWVWADFYIDPVPTPTPSNTPTPTASNTPTNTPVPPTNTPIPPTDTPVPPPTDTPVPIVCPDFTLSGSGDDGNNEVWWDVTNTEVSATTITRIQMDWSGGGNLEWIELDGTQIWTGGLSDPVDISSGWEPPSRVIGSAATKELRISFSSSVSNIYTVTVHSSNSCAISDSHDAD